MNIQLAEFIDAMIGDGCISIINSRSEKRLRKVALLTGHIRHDYKYFKEVIRPIIQREFCINGYLQKRISKNCVYLIMGNPVFNFLYDLNFPVGIKSNLRIPDIIIRSSDMSKACVRGIFNTDGTIYSRYSKKYFGHTKLYDYLVIQFKIASIDVIEQIKKNSQSAKYLYK